MRCGGLRDAAPTHSPPAFKKRHPSISTSAIGVPCESYHESFGRHLPGPVAGPPDVLEVPGLPVLCALQQEKGEGRGAAQSFSLLVCSF